MNNECNLTDVKLVTCCNRIESLFARPNFHIRPVFTEDPVDIELRKRNIKFNKTLYIGMCTLDISKTCLYIFLYDYMVPNFAENCKIIYTDTGNLIYEITCDNVYDVMKRNIHRFHTSDYAEDNPHGVL
jgi:Mg2+ and Co2+ transporter CorA